MCWILSYTSHRSCAERGEAFFMCNVIVRLWCVMCALGPSVKIIKRNTRYSRSRPFSCSVDVVMLKDVYGPVKPLRFQGKWFRFIRYRVHSNYKAIYQAWEELQPQRQQLSCGVNKVNLACCSGRLTGRTKGFHSFASLAYFVLCCVYFLIWIRTFPRQYTE